MRNFVVLIFFFVFLKAASATPESRDEDRTPKQPYVCDPRAKGKDLAKKQSDAIVDFADLFLVKKDVQATFDRWIPGEYIQHSPSAPRSGRQPAIDALIPVVGAPGVFYNHVRTWAADGYGFLHYKINRPEITLANLDFYRFEGTCIVEHWDVQQRILGNETNPIAFF